MNKDFFYQAYEEALKAQALAEVPVGAVVVHQGVVVGRGHNRVLLDHDATAHAEIVALRQACATLNCHRLDECDLYVTLEPCPMCASALSHAHIRRVIFGAYDPKGGAIDHGVRLYEHPSCHHKPEWIGGVMEQACTKLLKDFFAEKR